MARGRMINQTIDYDPEFNALSIDAQMLYLRSLAFLDRDGLIIGNPRGLHAKVAPLLDFSQGQMMDIIDQWVDMGLVIRYRAKVGDVLFFKGFAKNQSGMHYDRESPSRFEPPPGWTHGPKGLVQIVTEPTPTASLDGIEIDSGELPTTPLEPEQTNSGTTPAEVRQESGETPTQIEVEVKDQDQLKPIEDDEDTRVRDPIHQAWFETYSEEMPEPIEKPAAKLLKETSEAAVIHGIRQSVNSESRSFGFIAKCARNYIPAPPIAPPPPTELPRHRSGNGRSYQVDIPEKEVDFMPGVHPMTPPANPSPQPLPSPMALDDPWAVALNELSSTLPGRSALWLEGSKMVESELAGETFCQVILYHPEADIQWLTQQTEPTIRRKLHSILRKRVNVGFILNPVGVTA